MSNIIIELYNNLIKTLPNVERKGKTTPYTSVNGHMFSFLSKDGTMGLRLSEEDRSAFLENHSSQLMEQHGRKMKEYVSVSFELLEDTNQLSEYLQKSYNYVSKLKAKSSMKKK